MLTSWRQVSLAMVMTAAGAALGACATTGGVPRPFPGAALPPGAGVRPPEVAAQPGDTAAPLPPVPAAAEPPARLATTSVPPAVVATALEYRGVPYRNGGSTPDGFDCSGLVQWVFARNGILLPREVRDQFGVGREVDRQDVQPGDLLFFDTLSGGASHVGIALGGDQFVHAPSSRGVVRVERLTVDYWKKRWLGARRVGE